MIDHFQEYLALYMFGALVLGIFSGFPVAFVLGGTALIFGFIGTGLDVFSFREFFNILPRVWGGAAQNLILVAIPCFIFMGIMLEKSEVATNLLRALQVMMRRQPGALALAVTVMGTIMAATTGIIGASVVMMTVMALPTMLKAEYDTGLATGTIASSATLGILIPPSIMLVVIADLLSISVGNLFLGAVFPGLILSGLYMVYIFIFSRLNPNKAPSLTSLEETTYSSAEVIRLVLVGIVPASLLIILVLGSIFAGWATPTEASGIGALGATALALYNRKLNWALIKQVCIRTAETSGMIFLIVVGATAFSYLFRSLYGEDLIIAFVEWTDLESWGLLLMILGVVFALGFFFDWIEITLIVLPVFTPVVTHLDFGDHIASGQIIYWFAILFAINLQTSFLTPPFGFALFYMKGVAPKEVKLSSIYRGIIPFVLLQLLGLIMVILWPEIALWLPSIAL